LDITSTDAEIAIVFKTLYSSAIFSIHCNVEFDSNVTDASDVHLDEQDVHTTSTDAGI
jgi:hypothetical protein